jgi:hypothetical protein
MDNKGKLFVTVFALASAFKTVLKSLINPDRAATVYQITIPG